MISGFQKNQLPRPLVDKEPDPKMRLSRENRVANKRKRSMNWSTLRGGETKEGQQLGEQKHLCICQNPSQRNQIGVIASSVMARAQRKFRLH